MMETGFVHIYTGEGKGKTTSSVGMGVRALSHGLKVCYSYFSKNPSLYGNTEVNTLEKLGATIMGEGNQHPSFNKNVTHKRHSELTKESFENLKKLISHEDFDMLIMDEVLISVGQRFIDENDLIVFIQNKPKKLEIVMTGRDASDELIDIADYVSYIGMVKHPYEKGIESREGIEY
ncbi:MAG: cob(I)yrinic acid a,c-diamide adenosyltransferase [Flavobacteriales bacterium]|nr:cob(I)yrinic acid a,c-diamide adenosyltransferase [Flavobacteriales bacterium]